MMLDQQSLAHVIEVFEQNRHFLLATHVDPDTDGVGSLLALGLALSGAGKDVLLITEETLPKPLNLLPGAELVVQNFDSKENFDAIIVLDCGEMERAGKFSEFFKTKKPLINIDHHETNVFFGDVNLVNKKSSSTAEIVYKVIVSAGLPLGVEVAENIFAAIQGDTGSFRYENTSSSSLKVAAEMVDVGVKPWEISRKIMYGYSQARLNLLKMALNTVEYHCSGKIGIMSLSSEMYKNAKADRFDSERFVDYPRYINGVEMAVMIRQTGRDEYKFSLRSNNGTNVAELASKFGGGGHARAAGFTGSGEIGDLKKGFLCEAGRFLNGTYN